MICIYIYIYTLNPNDLYFSRSTPPPPPKTNPNFQQKQGAPLGFQETNFQTFTKERFWTGRDAGPDWTPSDWPVMENICIIYLHLDTGAGIFTYIWLLFV